MPPETISFFTATVISTDAGTYHIRVAPQGDSSDAGITQGIPVASLLSNFLGFKEAILPQVNSTVLCLRRDEHSCWLLGTIPDFDRGERYANRANTGGGDAHSNDSQNLTDYASMDKLYLLNNRRPTDVVAGEYIVGNEFGVLLGLFQQMAILKGSDLAQVQCFLLDDLVRVISHNFEHYTALGGMKIYHDGKRIGLEAGATSLPAESLGVPNLDTGNPATQFTVNNDLGNKIDDTKNFYSLKTERALAVERMKFFLGGLSDFLDLFIVAPNKDNTYAVDGAALKNPDRGLLQVHAGLDGGFYLRSLKEVVIEKTNWIRVPQRIRTVEDDTGNNPPASDSRPSFTFDQSFQFNQAPHVYALQLRDYLSQLQESIGYLDYKFNNKDFYLNNDISKETSLTGLPIAPNRVQDYVAKTAGMYLMPNGGILLKDAFGSAITMEGGNIYLQPAKDLVCQPLGNMLGKVGGYLNLQAYADIDLSSTSGSLRIKTERSQYYYSNMSGIVLEAAGTGLSTGTPTDRAISDVGGIVLKTDSAISTYSAQGTLFSSDSFIISQAGEEVMMEGKTGVELSTWGSGNISLYSNRGVDILGEGPISVAGQSLTAAGRDSTQIGLKDKSFGVAKVGGKTGTAQGTMEADELGIILAINAEVHQARFQGIAPSFQETKKFTDLKFKYLKSSSYGLDPEADLLPQTIAQQEETKHTIFNLTAWEETAINDTLPYPGTDLFETFYVTNSNLDGYEEKDKELYATGLSGDRQAILTRESLNTYTRKS